MDIYGDFQTSVRRALTEIDPQWGKYLGLIVCGSHTPQDHDIDFILDEIKLARENEIPFLGICFGHQLAAIEYARNVLDIKDATSEEFGTGTFVVKKRPHGLIVGVHDGQTYWSNYEVDLIGWREPAYFLTVPYHPEYQSSIDNPHPVLVDFLKLCSAELPQA